MALPVEKRPLCYRIPERIYTGVFEAVGAASMCWKPRPGQEVFAAEEASKVATDLCFLIAEEIEKLSAQAPLVCHGQLPVPTAEQAKCKHEKWRKMDPQPRNCLECGLLMWDAGD